MDRRHLQLVLRHAASVGCPAEPDALLLKRYARDRDEVAFTELVRRHGRLVWALCRNLLPSEADADDAFQATFLALAKSAGSVRDANRLGPWLHGVAYRVCLKSKREAGRRKRRQEMASTKEAVRPVADSAWDAALAAVHEEVHQLPEALRVAFVLCCLEGKGATEAAEQLGWKLGTLSGRLTRAKEAIIARLEARGIAAAVVGAAVVSGGASGGVPAAVVARAAELVADGAVVPGSILSLSQGVVGMAIHRTKLLAAVVLLVGGLSAGIGSGWVANAQQPNKPQDVPPAKAAADDVKRLQSDLSRALEQLDQQRLEADEAKKAVQAERDLLTAYAVEALAQVGEKKTKEAAVASTKKWDYDFVLVSEMGTTKFVQFLQDRETRGWDFAGGTTLSHQGKMLPHWVFRRPAQNVVQGEADLLRLQGKILEDTDRLLLKAYIDQVAVNEAARNSKPNATVKERVGADRAAELEAQIRQLQAQLDAIRKQSRTSAKATKIEMGLDPQEMMTILNKLAPRRFGKDARDRLQLSAGSDVLMIDGDAEAVKWATDTIKMLTEK